MENKVAKNLCTGCGACFNICPKNAISMIENSEGFLYPQINKDKCINCSMCEKACPLISGVEKHPVQQTVYALRAEDKIRMNSSSGGAFGLIAKEILKNGGYVCGASFSDDCMKVEHIIISDEKDLHKLQTSKYVQSYTNQCFTEIKTLLNGNKTVLFSGTPCQVAGLNSFLGKNYNNLITIDVLCHGGASPMIWREYLKEVAAGRKVKSVNFRFKKRIAFKINISLLRFIFNNGDSIVKTTKTSAYYKAFLNNLILRKSCHTCNYTTPERVSDITLGDFYGVNKFKRGTNDKKGISLYMANTSKGIECLTKIAPYLKINREVPIKYALKGNPILTKPSKEHINRQRFFANFKKGESMKKQILNGLDPNQCDGIITNFWRTCNNYGAVLTAWAIQQYFKNKGYNYLLLNYNTKKNLKRYKKSFACQFAKKYLNVTTEVNSSKEMKQVCKNVENFVVGSDQVFAELTMRACHRYILFSESEFNKRRVAFSASFGKSEFATSKTDLEIYKKLFSRFDALSVREDSGVDIIKNNFALESEHIIDPVFLIDKSAYDIFIDKEDVSFRDKVVCYILDYSKDKENKISEFAASKNLEVVNLANKNISVEEFLTAIYNCRYFLTDSFHGACFSLIFHKDFCCFVNKFRGLARFESIMRTFNLKEQFIEDVNNFAIHKVDWQNIDYIITKEQQKTDAWFKEVFETPLNKTEFQKENEDRIKYPVKFSPLVTRIGLKNMLYSKTTVDKKVVLRLLGIKFTYRKVPLFKVVL